MAALPPDESSSALRRLDDALVPWLQRRARGAAGLAAGPVRGLRRFDDRVAGGRPARAATEHRGVVAFLVVVILFGAASVNFQRYPVLQEQARADAAPRTPGDVPGGDALPGEDPTAAPGPVVGPLVDARVEPYLASRRDALAAAPARDRRPAVVSFADFLEPGEVEALLEGIDDVHLVQYRLPERTPRPAELVVDGTVADTVQRAITTMVDDLRTEEAEVESTLESGVEDESFRADYEARLDELRALRNTLTSDPAILFAVVVTGSVEQLRSLAEQPAVRLVDVAPDGTVVDETTFFGVLPTDQDRFAFGRSV